MTIREELEWTEHLCLSERAQFSDATRGRPRPEEAQENDVRTCYQRDSDRILHSKSFRRLMHKTQVFLQPEGDHYRTRMTHTLEVARIAQHHYARPAPERGPDRGHCLRPRSRPHAVRPRRARLR